MSRNNYITYIILKRHICIEIAMMAEVICKEQFGAPRNSFKTAISSPKFMENDTKQSNPYCDVGRNIDIGGGGATKNCLLSSFFISSL